LNEAAPIERLPRRQDAFMLPRPVEGAPGRFVVDATWGRIMPMQLAPGVRTVGELEVLAHIEAGLPLIDTRLPKDVVHGTLPSARAIAHTRIAECLGGFDPVMDTILFCNGPQCAATPDAIRRLLDVGYPPDRLLYYRGGIHDWVTLGLPLEPQAEALAGSARGTGPWSSVARGAPNAGWARELV
jgi:rhodanese-related sulfurtransferase